MRFYVNLIGMLAIGFFQIANIIGFVFNSGERMKHVWGFAQWFVIAIVFQLVMAALQRRDAGQNPE